MEKYFEDEWRQKWFDTMRNFCKDTNYTPISWFWKMLSVNLNATMEFIFANIDHPWDWRLVSSNVNLSLDYVLANPDKPWDWENLTTNPNITHSQMNDHANLPWEKYDLIVCGKIRDVFLPKAPRKRISPWLQKITPLESLEMLQLITQPNKELDYQRIAYDENLPLNFVVKYIEKFKEHAREIYQNEFTTDKHHYILYYTKWMHLLTIYETHMENAKSIDCSNLSPIEHILFDEFLVSNLLKW